MNASYFLSGNIRIKSSIFPFTAYSFIFRLPKKFALYTEKGYPISPDIPFYLIKVS